MDYCRFSYHDGGLHQCTAFERRGNQHLVNFGDVDLLFAGRSRRLGGTKKGVPADLPDPHIIMAVQKIEEAINGSSINLKRLNIHTSPN